MDGGLPVVAPLGQQLIHAAMQGTIERVGALLDQGVAVDSRDGAQFTPLIWASFHGHRAVASLLVDRGANVNAEDAYGGTPATRASYGGHLDTLQLLVSRGADIHHRGHHGYRRAALEAAWAAGPHPSQVQRRRDERWARRGPLLTVLAEHAYRPLQLRAQAIAAAAVGAPLPVLVHSAKEVVFRHEGLARLIISYL